MTVSRSPHAERAGHSATSGRTRPHRGYVLGALLVLLASGLLGCGGSGNVAKTAPPSGISASTPATSASTQRPSTAKTTSAITKPQSARFAAAAEGICGHLNERIKATAPNPHGTRAEIGENAIKHAALERAATVELGKLTPPAELARDWGQIIRYRLSLADGLVELGHEIVSGNRKGIATLSGAKERAHSAMSAIARRDGFKACASIGSAS